MTRLPMQNALPPAGRKIPIDETFYGKRRIFAFFLICCALLIAAVAITSLLASRGGSLWFERGEDEKEGVGETGDATLENTAPELPPTPSEAVIPEGAIPIFSRDLSYLSRGEGYLLNETPYAPDLAALLQWDVSLRSSAAEGPRVLILHTHTSEGYLPAGSAYIEGAIGDAVYTKNSEQNVISVGETLCRILNEKGITAMQCTVMHDDPTLSGAYERSAETVRTYLERYPTIELVIDLHRDAVQSADGAYVRSEGIYDGEATAQVMAVVGTDANGTPFDNWQQNLALALQLRHALNQDGNSLGRPVYLRNASFYQELAPRALLLEIGSAANSPEEASRAAEAVGKALASLLCDQS